MNPYEILGLDQDCTDAQITKAFRKLSVKHHPDKDGDEEAFIKINAAVQILRDPFKRKMYDECRVCTDQTEEIFINHVINKFKEMINEWINQQINQGRDITLREFCNGILNNARAANNAEREKADKTINGLMRRKSGIKSKKDTLVSDMIQARIDDVKAQISRMEQEAVLIMYVTKKSEEYDSEEDDADAIMERFIQRTKESTFYAYTSTGGVV